MATNPPPTSPQPYGEIFDRGYQHYTGERNGRGHAIRRLIIYSIKRGLGIKKKWTAKILPVILYALAYIPAVVIVALLAFLPADEIDIGYASLYGTLELIILIWAAALAPEMLCDDRRENVLPLYFSRPLTRLDYLGAKAVALGVLMGTIIFGPPLLLFLGLVLVDNNPLGYLGDHVQDLLRIVVYGVLISAFYAALGLIISNFTTRKGIAAAILIIGAIMLTGIANGFWEALEDQSWRSYLVLFSPFDLQTALRQWIFGEEVTSLQSFGDDEVPGILYPLTVLAVVAAALAVLWRRYLQEE